MLRLMKCRYKQLLREKAVMFWALAFPIILGTMFHFTLTNLGETDLEPISVALVVNDESEQSKAFQTFVEDATDILDLQITDKASAIEQLENGEIEGIYETGTTHKLIVTRSSLNTSILQTLLDNYQKNEHMVMGIMQDHPENLEKAMEEMADYKSMTKSVDLNGAEQEMAMMNFLALIGMACLYGALLGVRCATDMQANLSALGARRSVTPTHRLKLVIADMLATFGVHFSNVLILLLYLRFVLRVNLGENFWAVMLVSAVGSMFGVALGIFVGSFVKLEDKMKIGFVTGISTFCCFLAGLMVGNMKDIVERNVPIINRINPAALISDAFYSITIYLDMTRYYRNILTLSIMAIVLIGVSFVGVRRERYDYI